MSNIGDKEKICDISNSQIFLLSIENIKIPPVLTITTVKKKQILILDLFAKNYAHTSGIDRMLTSTNGISIILKAKVHSGNHAKSVSLPR